MIRVMLCEKGVYCISIIVGQYQPILSVVVRQGVDLAILRSRIRFPGAGANFAIFIGLHIRRYYWWSSQEAESGEISFKL